MCLDLSTSCTGWALFDKSSKKLLAYGKLQIKVPGIHKMSYPEGAYHKIIAMSNSVAEIMDAHLPDILVVEEVNRGINRIGQKSLDALHFFVLAKIDPRWLKEIHYLDSNGKRGWRPLLGIKLSKADKDQNKKIRAEAKRKKIKNPKVVDWKLLAERWVNAKYGTNFNVQEVDGDADVCDAIACGDAFINYVLKP